MQVLAASDADADEERVASDSISRSSSSVSASEWRYTQARRVAREKYDRSGENYTIAIARVVLSGNA